MLERVSEPYRKVLLSAIAHDPPSLEAVLWSLLYRYANREFYRSVLNIGVVLGFYLIRKLELMNLIRVIEGFAYELDSASISRLLIRPHAA